MHIPSLVPIRAAGLPHQRELERLSNGAETTGCDRCHARIAELTPYFICGVPDGSFSIRCPMRVNANGAKSVLVGTYIGGGGDPWSRDDRRCPTTQFPDRHSNLSNRQRGRTRHWVAVPTTHPLDSFADAGICRLVPSISESMSLTEDDAQRLFEADLKAKVVKTSAELRSAGLDVPNPPDDRSWP
jgi:hypothetical protein